jgi:bifunctional DNA-binding transcriptional regulator/antitoxin component of YhaV-PrlF toxin-antitoxin module
MRKYRKNSVLVGVKKEFDSLNRIVIPKDLRDLFNFGKEVEVIATPEGVLIRNPEWRLVKTIKKEDVLFTKKS